MNLTPHEQKSLQSLIKRQRQWRWSRVVILVVAVGVLVAGGWMQREFTRELISNTRNMSWTESPTGAEVFFASCFGGLLGVTHLFPGLAGLLIGGVLARWRGNPVDELLIRVVLSSTDAGPQESDKATNGLA